VVLWVELAVVAACCLVLLRQLLLWWHLQQGQRSSRTHDVITCATLQSVPAGL
jgi:hypothetical protein